MSGVAQHWRDGCAFSRFPAGACMGSTLNQAFLELAAVWDDECRTRSAYYISFGMLLAETAINRGIAHSIGRTPDL